MNTITLTLTSEPGMSKGILLEVIAHLLTREGLTGAITNIDERSAREYKLSINHEPEKFDRIHRYYSGINPAS